MTNTYLERILTAKRARIPALQNSRDFERLLGEARDIRNGRSEHRFSRALSTRGGVIAEIKRKSPSRGLICADANVAQIAAEYEAGGAAAISILTEEDFFGGSLADLAVVRSASGIPVLRKDFVISDFQVYESAASGADAILLIVAALTQDELRGLLKIATHELGMDAIVEVHSEHELERAYDAGAVIIGVNNRNLSTFETSLDVSRRVIASKRPDVLFITESGIKTPEHVEELKSLGYDGFLIGESLMRSSSGRKDMLASLVAAARKTP